VHTTSREEIAATGMTRGWSVGIKGDGTTATTAESDNAMTATTTAENAPSAETGATTVRSVRANRVVDNPGG
jgi:hypothetical protein